MQAAFCWLSEVGDTFRCPISHLAVISCADTAWSKEKRLDWRWDGSSAP
jgi:hypothetical protein